MDTLTTAAGLTSSAFIPPRRRMLRGALALFALGVVARIVPSSFLNQMPLNGGSDFVIINGWVLPARYFRD